MDCSMPGSPVIHYLLEFAQIHVHCIGDAIQPSHPLLPSYHSAFNLSQHQGLFQWVDCHIRWPKLWSFSFSISASNEYSWLISFKTDWFDLLAKLSSLVQFSCSVVSKSLWPHGLQHARLLCPSPTPRACSNSCPLSRWCRPTISSSGVPFSSCLQFFPTSGAFPISQFFVSGGQSTGASASAMVILMSIQA